MRLIDNELRRRRHQCEEQRRHLAELELLAERLRSDATRLQGQTERASADGRGTEARSAIDRYRKVERSLVAIETQIETIGATLAAAEQELRGYERTAPGHRLAPAGNSMTGRTRRSPGRGTAAEDRDR